MPARTALPATLRPATPAFQPPSPLQAVQRPTAAAHRLRTPLRACTCVRPCTAPPPLLRGPASPVHVLQRLADGVGRPHAHRHGLHCRGVLRHIHLHPHQEAGPVLNVPARADVRGGNEGPGAQCISSCRQSARSTCAPRCSRPAAALRASKHAALCMRMPAPTHLMGATVSMFQNGLSGTGWGHWEER